MIEDATNWTTIKGNWNAWKGKARQEWGALTDDELTKIDGEREELVGLIQQRYGPAKEKAERQVDEFLRKASGL